MNLFEPHFDLSKNWLPKDGVVNYYSKIFNQEQSDYFLNTLLIEIKWQYDELYLFGKKIITKRKVAWYAEENLKYTYSNTTKEALKWTDELLGLKQNIQDLTGASFNSCLLNLYHDGNEGMGWHSDNESELLENGVIASLSFGAERKFSFKHRESKQKVDFILEHGSLIVMKGETQRHWIHQLPKTTKSSLPRINLTFRTVLAPCAESTNL
jgi:alkylated DNA repair dioxygenase AlkB